jgi:predicted ABC-type ATPase
MAEAQPSVIVLAGPNGAGKTTASRSLLADTLEVLTFVNADVIAQGLSGFDPDSAAFEASRIMLERMYALVEQRASFAFETTLAARTLAGWLREVRDSGYGIHLLYFWLESADLAVARNAVNK